MIPERLLTGFDRHQTEPRGQGKTVVDGRSVRSWVAHRAAAPPHGHRVRRPVVSGAAAAFHLAYVRTSGPRDTPPLLIVPGGPGLASVLPYRALRRDAAQRGLDVIMVEHRGVGLSRRDDTGTDLPQAAVTVEHAVDDLAGVLDHAGVDRAVVYGSSYGGYLAQAFGLCHPERVAAMVLDSPMTTAQDEHEACVNLRRLFRDDPEPHTARAAALLRSVLDAGLVPVEDTGFVTQICYEFAGAGLLERLLEAVLAGRGRRTWDQVARLGEREIDGVTRYVMESDLVGRITYTELGYGASSDGSALDPNAAFGAMAYRYPRFAGEPYDLVAAQPTFSWPIVVLSGVRDLRVPRFLAERIVAAAPDAVLVPFDDLGHSVLDSHRLAALHVGHAAAAGRHRRLPDIAAKIAALGRRAPTRHFGSIIAGRLACEQVLGR